MGDDTPRYADEWEAVQHSEGYSFERELTEKRIEYILESIGRHGADRILEVGPGTSPLVERLTDFERYTAVDPVERFVESVDDTDERVNAIHGKIEDVTDEIEGEFDIIVLNSFVHEVPNPESVLTAVREVASDDTIVHVNVPNARSFHRLLAYELGLIDSIYAMSETDERFDRQSHFDMGSIRTLVDDVGFEVLETGTYVIKPFSNRQLDLLVNESNASSNLIDGLDEMGELLPDMGTELFVEARLEAE